QPVVIVASEDAALVDRDLEQIVGNRSSFLSHCENAQGEPIPVLRDLGVAAGVRVLLSLVRVFGRGRRLVAIHVNAVVLVNDVRAVVVIDWLLRVADVRVQNIPAWQRPDDACGEPAAISPATGKPVPPAAVETVPVVEILANG